LLLLAELHCLKIDRLWQGSRHTPQFVLNAEKHQHFRSPTAAFFPASDQDKFSEHVSVPNIFLAKLMLPSFAFHLSNYMKEFFMGFPVTTFIVTSFVCGHLPVSYVALTLK